jgi:metal-responsive CopG/Arc/MetJ family transcriptional regulator
VPVPKRLLEAVDKAASAFDTSRSELVRQAVRRDLERTGFAPTPAQEAT